MIVRVILVVFFSLLFGFAIGLSIGFFIFTLILKNSNVFGAKIARDDPRSSNLVIIAKEDRIQHRDDVFDYHITNGMRELLSNPGYHEMMSRSVKNPDNDQVTHI
ncbi:MAG: hypothetical protein IK020_04600 [Clostridiales bacterium]|nr:hypothetical protein [Clostridiales bacterium]